MQQRYELALAIEDIAVACGVVPSPQFLTLKQPAAQVVVQRVQLGDAPPLLTGALPQQQQVVQQRSFEGASVQIEQQRVDRGQSLGALAIERSNLSHLALGTLHGFGSALVSLQRALGFKGAERLVDPRPHRVFADAAAQALNGLVHDGAQSRVSAHVVAGQGVLNTSCRLQPPAPILHVVDQRRHGLGDVQPLRCADQVQDLFGGVGFRLDDRPEAPQHGGDERGVVLDNVASEQLAALGERGLVVPQQTRHE